MFEKRKLLIVSQHQKHKAFAPVLEEQLGVKVHVSTKINTDDFGTFSGEVDRKGTAIETAAAKCRAGLVAHQMDLGIASEGSYGPDPVLGFLPLAQETVVLIDLKNQLEINETLLSYQTNYQTEEVKEVESLVYFAKSIGFPEQGLILHAFQGAIRLKTLKDFNDFPSLERAFTELFQVKGATYFRADTDMRAHRNPTRMQLLNELAQRLTSTIKRICPRCSTPGFKVEQAVKGLPCQVCEMPTGSMLYQVLGCKKCAHEEKLYYPKGNRFEDPAYCDFCNP